MENPDKPFVPGKWPCFQKGKDLSLLCVGTMVRHGLQVARLLNKKGYSAAVYNCSSVRPLDPDTLRAIQGKAFFTMEEHMVTGGFGAYVREKCREMGLREPEICFGVQDRYLQHGNHSLLMRDAGLDPDHMTECIVDRMERSKD